MSNAQWFLLIGFLLLAMGLGQTLMRRAPITPAIIYLAVGLLVGPTVLHLFHFNPLKQSALLEVLTEVAVLIALFSAGVKMPVPLRWPAWRAPVLLATLAMSISVAMVAGFACYVLDLPLGAGILLGAIVAPTDPVLATEVQVRRPGDRNQLRMNLTCEAGMNDGSAFPFVVLGLGLLGLHDLGDSGLRWLLVDVLWAIGAAIALGVLGGVALARLSSALRRDEVNPELLHDFLGLGLIGVVYGSCVWVNAWGFIGVFAAAVALRQTETLLARSAHVEPSMPDAPSSTSPNRSDPVADDSISTRSLIFKEHLERLSELILVLLVGGSLFLNSWSWAAVGLALFVFLVARPLSVFLALLPTGTPWRTQGLCAWFGVRGMGSLYYLMYAIQHGLPESLALQLVHLTLIVVTLSILLHGISVKPMMTAFARRTH
ncbi:cation:proton antiporter [Pseudomarimonas salicorniae]|uniref:Cation:proton antiporter n=1 Tax=Pseudomarimonas salicorniae TaxID=2933270 RepID=A0ABT0GF83_9GAMM|nr:cation:proton antiporter [Lysobacter sp. CAU 1642]MCK7593012.1 cation:proton antiporter [Lysobacter sp. CAU 1642]